jgi:hypothetical protein
MPEPGAQSKAVRLAASIRTVGVPQWPHAQTTTPIHCDLGRLSRSGYAFFLFFSSYVQVWLSQSFTFAPLSWAFWQFWAFHAGCYDMTIPIGCSLMPFFWREEHGFCVMTTSPSIQFHPTTKETSRCHVAGMCCESPLSWSGEWSTSSLSYLGFRDNLKLFNRKT